MGMIVEIGVVLRKKGHRIGKDEVHETRSNKDCNLLISPLNLPIIKIQWTF